MYTYTHNAKIHVHKLLLVSYTQSLYTITYRYMYMYMYIFLMRDKSTCIYMHINFIYRKRTKPKSYNAYTCTYDAYSSPHKKVPTAQE